MSQHSGRSPDSQQVAPAEQQASPNEQQSSDWLFVEPKDATTSPSVRTEAVTIFVNIFFSNKCGHSDSAFTLRRPVARLQKVKEILRRDERLRSATRTGAREEAGSNQQDDALTDCPVVKDGFGSATAINESEQSTSHCVARTVLVGRVLS